MAETVYVQATSSEVKLRRPLGVFALIIVTLGIYYLVWYYKTNRELKDFGMDVRPGVALLAITLGALVIVPPFVSEWRYFSRIRAAQERAGVPQDERINHVVGFVLYLLALFFFPVEAIYAQVHLNRLWRTARSEQEQHALGLRGQPATA